MKKIIILIIALLVQSCGWLDEKWDEKKLIDRFSLINDINNSRAGTRLVLMDFNKNGYKSLIDNCIRIDLDSSRILVKSINFNSDTLYTKIMVASKKVEIISVNKYNDEMKSCDNCKQVGNDTE